METGRPDFGLHVRLTYSPALKSLVLSAFFLANIVGVPGTDLLVYVGELLVAL